MVDLGSEGRSVDMNAEFGVRVGGATHDFDRCKGG